MTIAERNRKIKKALKEGLKVREVKNIRVRGDRGTAYGWVKVLVELKRPHKGHVDSVYSCECDRLIDKVKKEIWKILEKTGLEKELGIYYTDMNEKRYEMIIDFKFIN